MEPLYVTRLSGQRTIRLVLGIATAVTTIGFAILYALEPDARTVAVVDAVLFAITFAFIYAILPERLEVWPDKLRIVFPKWRTWDIALESVVRARPARGWEPYAYYGMRFATNPGTAVVVERRNSTLLSNVSIIVSPVDRDEFLRALGGALEARRAPV